MDKEYLTELITKYKSTYKIGKNINKHSNTIVYWIKKYNLTSFYNEQNKRNLNGVFLRFLEDELKEVIKNCITYTDVLKYYNLVPRGKNFDTLKKYIEYYKIDISHFDPRKKQLEALNKINNSSRKNIKEYLKKDSNIKSNELKKKLYRNNILLPICSICGQDENWKGVKISLILDHIDGDHTNNELENLRIVCPNCNAGLDTFCGKNKRQIKNKIHKNTKKISCQKPDGRKNRNIRLSCRKVERPEKNILLKQIEEFGYKGTGRIYGVSDNAIRKWIK